MTSLHLFGADLSHAELCVLGRKFVVRPSPIRAYLKRLTGFSRHPPTFLDHEFLPLLLLPR